MSAAGPGPKHLGGGGIYLPVSITLQDLVGASREHAGATEQSHTCQLLAPLEKD